MLLMLQRLRELLSVVIALLLAIAICAGQEPQQKSDSPTHPGRAFGQKRKIDGVGNFGEVTPRLFRGAQPNPDGFKALVRMGIEIVVDARHDQGDSEKKEVGQLGMQYVGIPWHCSSPSDDILAKFLKLLRENPNKKVFVHCHLGKDRTGMMIAAYRMAAEGWTADEAMQEMQQFGFSKAHHLLCPGLAPYEKKFPEHLRNNPVFGGLYQPQPHPAP